MSSPLITDNILAMEPLIRARLEAALVDPRVGGFIEYKELLNGSSRALDLPAHFVWLADNDPAGNSQQVMLTQTWVVATVISVSRDANGQADMAPTGRLIASVVKALTGTALDASLKAMRWAGSDLMERNDLLFCHDVFSHTIDVRFPK